MSDHDAKPDPMDKAYVQAEALLSDEEARAARRARVFAAVARQPTTQPQASFVSLRRSAFQRGGWLAAAGVAGLSVVLAAQLRQQALLRPQSAPTPPTAPVPAQPRQTQAAPAPRTAARHAIAAAQTPTASPAMLPPAPRAFPAAPRAAAPVAEPDVPAPPPLPIPPAMAAQPKYRGTVAPIAVPTPPSPPAPPLLIPPAKMDQPKYQSPVAPISVPAPPPPPADVPAPPPLPVPPARLAFAAPPAAAPSSRFEATAGPQSDPAARLRTAASAGRSAEVEALLARGVPVDATDAEGNTALMKSIQADRPAVAALLRRHGASLDLTNRAGESAKDMAMAKGDAKLIRAIGLEP
jgi:hypothetical protein